MIGILKESSNRVALTPKLCSKLIKTYDLPIYMEAAAGASAHFADGDYPEGVQITSRGTVIASCRFFPSINPLAEHTLEKLHPDSITLSLYQPYNKPEVVPLLEKYPIHAYSFDMIPRSTLAQRVDVLSSMASLSGYKAVLLAAEQLGGCIPMMMTAAGTIKPANALILGAGVAGLQAIATAKRLGARVSAFDVRASSKQEVESLGAKFIEVEGAADASTAGGYAVEQSEAFLQRQRDLVHEEAQKADMIITSAQIRGRKAPILVEDRTIQAMKNGAVIVDLAQATGGNTSFTQAGKSVTENGVIIIGNSNLADTVSQDASELFANNVVNFFQYLFKDGQLGHDESNEILRASKIR